jgi:hypothetical protein
LENLKWTGKARQAILDAADRGGGVYSKHPILHGEFYCENRDCSVREVQIHVKDLAGTMRETISEVVCPLCRQPLKPHWVRTREESIGKDMGYTIDLATGRPPM